MKLRPDGLPRGPLTYVITYTEGLTTSDSWAEQMHESPPDFLHHGHDVPLNNLWGPTKGFSGWIPDHTCKPADINRKIDALRKGIDRLHGFGVGRVFPYVNASIIGGSIDKRTTHNFFSYSADTTTAQAFFHFWRRLDEFAEFGCDRIPKEDPLDWMQRTFFHFETDTPYLRYEPCLRRESWLEFLEIVVGLIAKAGYDGVFSDDNLVQCFCPQCQRDFREFLREEYADRAAELEARVPIAQTMLYSDDGKGTGPAMRRPTTGKLSVGPDLTEDALPIDPWATLLWEASQEFWGQTIGDMLLRVRDAGRKHNPNFFVVPNWGMSMTVKEYAHRRQLGHHFLRWQPGGIWQLMEDGGGHGYIAPGLAEDFWTLCRAYVAHGAEPALLAYTGGDEKQQLLGFAEVASVNAGAWVESGNNFAETRKAYRTFFENRWELFDQAEPFCHVGVLYSMSDILRNNDQHLRLVYAISRALGRSHIAFDLVIPENLRQHRFDLLINPGARAVSANHMAGMPVLTIGPGGLPPNQLIDQHEIELDHMLDVPFGEEQRKALADWASLDLSGPAPLAGLVSQIIGRDLRLTTAREAHSVRLRPFIVGPDKRLVVHVVNYGCTSMSTAPAPGTAPAFPLRIPEVDGWEVEGAWTEGPEVKREQLSVVKREAGSEVMVPPTDIYRIVVVQYR